MVVEIGEGDADSDVDAESEDVELILLFVGLAVIFFSISSEGIFLFFLVVMTSWIYVYNAGCLEVLR